MRFINNILERRKDYILKKYGDNITGIKDLTLTGHHPTILFYFIAGRISSYLDTDTSLTINRKSLCWRKKINSILKKGGRLFLAESQVFEDRHSLLCEEGLQHESDDAGFVPKEAVIYVSNHGFLDDVMTSVLTSKRHTYFITNALPEICNTVDGVLSFLNGVILSNGRVKDTKRSVIPKAVKALELGTDVLVFPEGTWNKSPNLLVLDLWPGVYKIASESKAMIVPIIHYIEDPSIRRKDNVIHTVVDKPFRVDSLPEEEALRLIRDKMATWYYLMMEKYGKVKRKDLMMNCNPDDIWSNHLIRLISTNKLYDGELENRADYRSEQKILPYDVWKPISNIENITVDNVHHYVYANKVVDGCIMNDYQRRY